MSTLKPETVKTEKDEPKTTWFPSLHDWELEDIDITEGYISTRPASLWSRHAIAKFNAAVSRQSDMFVRRSKSPLHVFTRLPIGALISHANSSFGYNGWTSEIIDSRVVSFNEESFEDDEREDRYTMELETNVRIILSDGTYVERSGTGKSQFLTDRGQCYSKAHKEAATDALKNCFYSFETLLLNYEERLKEGYYTYETLK